VTVLGGFAVAVAGHITPAHGWVRRSASALVKLLALAPGHQLHREQVLDILWPDDAPERSGPRLHKAAHYARRATGHPAAVVLRNDVVTLFPDADVTVDAIEFEQVARHAVSRSDATVARDALALYGGQLLPADQYEDWAADRRELLALRHLELLRLAGEWRDLAELDPTTEESHVKLMQRDLEEGDAAAVVRQYDHLARVLERELGVEPSAAARQARDEASALLEQHDGRGGALVERVVAELSGLVQRQAAIIAELYHRCGCAPDALRNAVQA
jgi:DNA-binding SARP family transcriptional activator